MVQCFILNEENEKYWHSITALYQFNNLDYGIDDYIFTKTYMRKTGEFKTSITGIDRNRLRNTIENPKLKLEAI